jgi:hypothetical protein
MHMSSAPDFQTFAAWIFKSMEIDNGAMASSGIYAITLSPTLQVRMLEKRQGAFCLMCVVGTVHKDTAPATLMSLLYANQFTFDYPQICLGVEPGVGSVVLSTHCALGGFTEAESVAQFERFADAALAVERWLAAGGKSLEDLREKRSSSSLHRLKSRQATGVA